MNKIYNNKNGKFLILLCCLIFSTAFLIFTNSFLQVSNRNQVYRDSIQSPKISDDGIKVAILNSDAGSDYSGWYGGNMNPYERAQSVLDARGYSTVIITNDDLSSGDGKSLDDMGIDVLVLPDNGPTDTAAAAIGDWNRNYNGHIVSMDSSVVVLFYEGLITGEIHSTNYHGVLWGYGTEVEGEVINSTHPVMDSYSLHQLITGTSGNCEFYESDMNTELGTDSKYFHPLVADPAELNRIFVAAFNFPGQGRFVQMWDQYPEDETHDTENLYVSAVDWVYSGSVSVRPDLDVSFISAPQEGEGGSTISYSAKVTNIGTDTATDINFNLDIDGSTEASNIGFSLSPEESYTLSVDYILPSSGSITINAHSNSVSGETVLNNNEKSTSTSIVADPAPSLSYNSLLTYAEGTAGNIISIAAQDDDPHNYRYSIDGESWSTYCSWSNDIDIEINVDGLAIGYHQLDVEVYDIHSFYSTANVEINVEEVSDRTPPTINNPSDISVSEGYTGQSITWSVDDAYPSTYTITCNSSEVVSATSWTSGDITYTIPDGKLKGEYTFEITVSDDSGNQNSDVVLFNVNDADAPSISSPSDISVSEGYTGQSITWSVDDAYPSTYTITCNSSEVVSATSWTSGDITYTIPDGKLKGEYTFEITVSDDSGNQNSDVVLFNVNDADAPSISSPSDISVSEGYSNQSITWSVSDAYPHNYSITMNNSIIVSNQKWSNGTITYNISEGKGMGEHIYKITIEDESGNNASDTVKFTVKSNPKPNNDNEDEDEGDDASEDNPSNNNPADYEKVEENDEDSEDANDDNSFEIPTDLIWILIIFLSGTAGIGYYASKKS